MLEELTGVKNKAETCGEYRLTRQSFSRWRAAFAERVPVILPTKGSQGHEQVQFVREVKGEGP